MSIAKDCTGPKAHANPFKREAMAQHDVQSELVKLQKDLISFADGLATIAGVTLSE